jgi:hypothetical protein
MFQNPKACFHWNEIIMKLTEIASVGIPMENFFERKSLDEN